MAEIKTGERLSYHKVFDSTLDSVDLAEEETLRISGLAGLDEEESHRTGMAIREAMVNAVVHGNRYDRRRKVHFSIFEADRYIRIVIQDEGEGFDVNSLPDPTAEENLLRHSGRGLLLMRAFVDECRLRSVQPRGTEIQLIKQLSR